MSERETSNDVDADPWCGHIAPVGYVARLTAALMGGGVLEEAEPDLQPGPRPLSARQAEVQRRLQHLGPNLAERFLDLVLCLSEHPPRPAARYTMGWHIAEIEGGVRGALYAIVPEEFRVSAEKGETHRAEVCSISAFLSIAEPIRATWFELLPDGRYPTNRLRHRNSLGNSRPLDGEFREFCVRYEELLEALLDGYEVQYARVLRKLDGLLEHDFPTTKARRAEVVKTLREHVGNNEHTWAYLFDRLDDPAWAPVLDKAALFDDVPQPVLTPDLYRLPRWPQSQFLARVSNRAADPQAFLALLRQIGRRTANARVHDDIARAASGLPSSIAVGIAADVVAWLELPYHTVVARFAGDAGAVQYPCRVADFAVHLYRGDQQDVALSLLRLLLDVEVCPPPDEGFAMLVDDLRTYGHVLSRVVPLLGEDGALAVMSVLMEILGRASADHGQRMAAEFWSDGSSLEGDVESESGSHYAEAMADLFGDLGSAGGEPAALPLFDLSHIWCPSLLDPRDTAEHALQLLVSAVFSGVARLAGREPDCLSAILGMLDGWPGVGSRIALQVLASTSGVDPEIVRPRLLDRRSFASATLRYEYAQLLLRYFPNLEPPDQAEMLQWVELGPDLEAHTRIRERMVGEAPDEAALGAYANRWRAARLWPISSYLPREWKERLCEWRKDSASAEVLHGYAFGCADQSHEPDDMGPDVTDTLDTRVHADAPPADARSFATTLIASRRGMRPKRRGRSDRPAAQPSPDVSAKQAQDEFLLRRAARSHPWAYSSDAEAFINADSYILRALAAGLGEAVRSGERLSWGPVLSTLGRVAPMLERTPAPGRMFFSWEFSDDTVTLRPLIAWFELILEGIRRPSSGLDREFSGEILAILTRCLLSRHESALARARTRVDGPATSRDLGLEALLQPGSERASTRALNVLLWMLTWLDREDELHAGDRLANGVRRRTWQLLERFLRQLPEEATEERALVGRNVPVLHAMDPEWVRARLSLLLPEGLARRESNPSAPPAEMAALSAWCGFLMSEPSGCGELFERLRSRYEWSIRRLSVLPDLAAHALSHHLFMAHFDGRLNPGDPSDLLTRLFESTVPEFRRWCLEKVGASLRGREEDEASLDRTLVAERASDFWNWRMQTLIQAPAEERIELAAYGVWYAEGRIARLTGDEAALEHLRTIVGATRHLAAASRVISEMRAAAARSPALLPGLIEVLDLLRQNGHLHAGIADDLRGLLAQAACQPDPVVARKADVLINRLLADGFTELTGILAGDPRRPDGIAS